MKLLDKKQLYKATPERVEVGFRGLGHLCYDYAEFIYDKVENDRFGFVTLYLDSGIESYIVMPSGDSPFYNHTNGIIPRFFFDEELFAATFYRILNEVERSGEIKSEDDMMMETLERLDEPEYGVIMWFKKIKPFMDILYQSEMPYMGLFALKEVTLTFAGRRKNELKELLQEK